MKSVTVKQVRELDEVAIQKYGVPSLCLMETAGHHAAMEALKLMKNVFRPRIVVLCGLGNNAGDGFVAARHLINAGVNVATYLIGPAGRLKHDPEVNFRILKKCGYRVHEVNEVSPALKRSLQSSDLVIDAIFGAGLNREVGEPHRSFIELINRSRKKILAVDIPSGLDGTTGEIYGVCVKASKTVTFSFAKKGFFKNEGPRHTGSLTVVDIGIPDKIKKNILHGR